jgi:hypothetical protein
MLNLRNPNNVDKKTQEILKAKTGRKRVVFRSWPRDPLAKEKYIKPENTLPGKTTSNGMQLWGATLYDFYRVRRVTDLDSLSTISTGSKLAAWMKANGELEFAKPEIEWAEMEADPQEVPPCDIGGLMNDFDFRISMKIQGVSMPSAAETDREAKSREKGKKKAVRCRKWFLCRILIVYASSPYPMCPHTQLLGPSCHSAI